MKLIKTKTGKEIKVHQSTDMWGMFQTFETNIGTFKMMPSKLDTNGNKTWLIVPMGFIVCPLPKVTGYRRNNKRGFYTTQSVNTEETMEHFLITLFEELEKGNRLYVNFKIYTK